jgi:protein-tyrosine phosphatase
MTQNKGVRVSSAGLTALVDKPADPSAISIAAEHDIDMQAHRARQINTELVAQNALILVMEQRQLDDLCHRYPQARGKTFLLGKWIGNEEIPDPYKKSIEAFTHVFKLIEKSCQGWIKYL